MYKGLSYHNKIRTVEGYEFKLAKPHSKNPNHIYVMMMGLYLGKVCLNTNKFFPYNKNDGHRHYDNLVNLSNNFEESLKEYGKKYGYCAVCYKMLTVEKSLERGMGKICYKNFFG